MLTSQPSNDVKTTMALKMLQRVDTSKDDPTIICFVGQRLQDSSKCEAIDVFAIGQSAFLHLDCVITPIYLFAVNVNRDCCGSVKE